MKLTKAHTLMLVAILMLVTFCVNSGHSQIVIPCGNIGDINYTDEEFGAPIVITSAITSTTIGLTVVPPYCDVRGTIWPDIGFNIKVPIANWNRRFYMTGWRDNDGGEVNESGMISALQNGFTTAGSDGGHAFTVEPFFWAYNPLPANTNPNAKQKQYDFYFRANHETAVLAKNIIGAYYGSGLPLLYSYFEGVSDGGRQALVQAQLYPQDFDGIIAAYPVMNCAWGNTRYIWNKQARDEADITSTQVQAIAQSVYSKCDSIDGLVDGFIDDPRKCPFNPDADLEKCPSSATCFNNAQIATLNKIYLGPTTTSGARIYTGTPFGSEVFDANGLSGWQQYGAILPMPGPGEILINDAIGFLKYMAFDPPAGPLYDYTSFDIDTDLGLMANTAAWCSVENSNLLPFKVGGHKLIQWHGYADAVTSPQASIDYYEGVMENMGTLETMSFYKLYMIPGAFNGGGIGCSDINWLAVIQGWVENGIEPGAIVGVRSGGGGYNPRTRPACPYPQVARYLGTGSIDVAANFRCAYIVPSSLQIKPNRISISGRGTFNATLTLPEGYDARNFTQIAVSCEGAPGEKVKIAKQGRVIKARFTKTNVQNITQGRDVVFTVTAIYELGGQLYAFEGSESIRVLD
jgi:feruloyl esterase